MAEDGIFGFDGTPSVAILANRSSGLNGRGAAVDAIVSTLSRFGVYPRIFMARGGKLAEAIAACKAQAPDVVVVTGGDGTILAVAEAFLGTPTIIAVVPQGTVNQLARDLLIPLLPDAAIEALVSGEVRAEQFLSLKRDGGGPPLAPRSSALRGTEWRVIEIDGGRPIYDERRQPPRLRLDDNGKFSGTTGCNSMSGSYQLDPDGLRFEPAATTLMGCPAALADTEKHFLDALSAIRQAQLAGTTLDLLDATSKRRLRLEARGR